MILTTPDGFTLSTLYHEIPNSRRIIIFAHGMTVDKDDEGVFVRAEKELNLLGISTIRFDFRAHGESSGHSGQDFTISGELTDLTTIVSYAKNKGYTQIGLAGASFGGGISALYVGIHPENIDALLLVNPALDYRNVFLEPTTVWGKQYFTDAVERLRESSTIKVEVDNLK